MAHETVKAVSHPNTVAHLVLRGHELQGYAQNGNRLYALFAKTPTLLQDLNAYERVFDCASRWHKSAKRGHVPEIDPAELIRAAAA